jgi:hypothetical protein
VKKFNTFDAWRDAASLEARRAVAKLIKRTANDEVRASTWDSQDGPPTTQVVVIYKRPVSAALAKEWGRLRAAWEVKYKASEEASNLRSALKLAKTLGYDAQEKLIHELTKDGTFHG